MNSKSPTSDPITENDDDILPSRHLTINLDLHMVSPLRSEDFLRVLRRAQEGDDLGDRIARALELIQGAMNELTEQAVALSFNGGKDCTVLLHLFAAALYARHATVPEDIRIRKVEVEIPSVAQSATTESIPSMQDMSQSDAASSSSSGQEQPEEHIRAESQLYPPVKSVYITAPNHFPELDDFTDDSVTRYGMDLHRFGGNMKAALTDYLSCGGGKGVRGILVGTRTGDPNGRKSFDYVTGNALTYRCEADRSHRPALATILADTSYSGLDILGNMGVSTRTGSPVLPSI